MSVSPFRLTAKQLQPRIRQCAKDSSKVIFTPQLIRQSMAGAMTWHQVIKTLREGTIVGTPERDEHGNWLFKMTRFAASTDQTVEGAAMVDGAHVVQIVVFTEKLPCIVI